MTVTSTFHMELVNHVFDTRYTDIMLSRSGLYPREAFHRWFFFRASSSFILEGIFSKLDSGFQSLVGFWILSAGFRIPKPRIPIPQAKNSRIPESGFPYMGRFDDLVTCILNAGGLDTSVPPS